LSPENNLGAALDTEILIEAGVNSGKDYCRFTEVVFPATALFLDEHAPQII
jgi:hypothetical protein